MYVVTFHYPKGILGQGGGGGGGVGEYLNKLKEVNFNFPVTIVMYLSKFLTHVQKKDIKLLNLKRSSFLNISALLIFEK